MSEQLHTSSRGDIVLTIAAAAGLSVTAPLLDLLGRNPGFFAAHGAGTADLVLLAVGLGIMIPAGLAGLVLAAGWISPRVGVILHVVLLEILLVLLALQLLDRLLPSRWILGQLLLALTAGALVIWGAKRSRAAGVFVRVAAVAPLLSMGLFLFASDTSTLVFARDPAIGAGSPVRTPMPVVLVILDELPASALRDARGDLDEENFPHLARLASRADWFRNATSVHDFTNWALPAMLTGMTPDPDRVAPVFSQYPDNLFTMLMGSHRIHAHEEISHLCPVDVCRSRRRTSIGDRWRRLGNDLLIVSGHVLLPERATRDLPAIDGKVAHFHVRNPAGRRADDEIARTRVAELDRFVAGIPAGDRPPFVMLHTLLPHRPWDLLPTGQRYHRQGASDHVRGGGWSDDRWQIQQSYQRFLLQAQYTDRFLGTLLNRLERRRLLERSLVIITADHGMAFTPGLQRRRFTESNLGEAAVVPLFVKRPGQRTGRVIDRRVHLTDIVPTIAELVGADAAGPFDGRSLYDRTDRGPSTPLTLAGRKIVIPDHPRVFMTLPEVKRTVLQRGIFGVTPDDAYHDLLGRRLDDLSPTAGSIRARLEDPALFEDVDPDGTFVPALLAGRISGHRRPLALAIVLNGRVVAVTRSFGDNGTHRFQAMLPPSSLRAGRNTIEMVAVHENGTTRSFERVL